MRTLAFLTFRIATVSAVFLLVMAPFGVYATLWGVFAAFVVQLLVGLAFATPVYALSAGLRDETAFALVYRLGVIPLTLFSGAFFPIASLPGWLEALAVCTPLWHGVDLTRMFTLDTLDGSLALVHAVYLAAVAAAGYCWACRRLTNRLAD